MLKFTLDLFNSFSSSLNLDLYRFLIDRLRVNLKNKDIRTDLIESVLSHNKITYLTFNSLIKRIEILQKTIQVKKWKVFLTNYKRINNIVKPDILDDIINIKINVNLFENTEEHKLYTLSKELKHDNFNILTSSDNLDIFMKKIFDLNSPIEDFFSNVTINHEDNKIRNNRLLLLNTLKLNIEDFANFNLIDA